VTADTNSAEAPYPAPRHIAIIMDGNGRWASAHGKSRYAGHQAGVGAARAIAMAAVESGIKVLTLFAFSSENWNRPADEVNGLMHLFFEVLQQELDELQSHGIQLRFIGAREHLPEILRKRIAAAEAKTAGEVRMVLVLAVAYGGRWDLVQATQRIAAKVRAGDLQPDDIDEAVVSRHMALAGLPAPDLLIRTGGEQRVSNFLLWDLAYTEILFSPAFWPDFRAAEFAAAVDCFRARERRYGRTRDRLEALAD